jgi:hypothetical protein
MDKKKDSKYPVGYKKPPRHTQFKAGQSGNPQGRPKKSTTFDDDVEAELRSPVIVVEGGKRRRMTKRRAIAKQHVNKALGGDAKSAALLLFNSRRQPQSNQDNLEPLLREFREKNRRLSENTAKEDDDPTKKGE